MTTPRTGHPTESELNWQRSPMWLAMMDAAAECGLTDRMPEARITDAKVWAKTGDPCWPSEDKATRARFHALWTANVQARCGIDPLSNPGNTAGVPQEGTLATVADGGRGRPRKVVVAERTAAMVAEYHSGATTKDLAATYGLSVSRVQYALRGAGVDLKERLRIATPVRVQVVELFTSDPELSVAEVARKFGVSRQAVSEHLRKAGVEPYRSSIHSRNARIRWARVRRQEAA